MDTYKIEMRKLAEAFMKDDQNKVTRPALSVPNEICDFLDNNGFVIEYNGSDVTITRIHWPKYVGGGWSTYTYHPLATTSSVSTAPEYTTLLTQEQIDELLKSIKTSVSGTYYTSTSSTGTYGNYNLSDCCSTTSTWSKINP